MEGGWCIYIMISRVIDIGGSDYFGWVEWDVWVGIWSLWCMDIIGHSELGGGGKYSIP